MRQQIRRRRKSKDWMLTYGLTTLFVVGSLWYLDLLPTGLFTADRSGYASHDSDITGSTRTVAESPAPVEQDEIALEVEQSEPDIATIGNLSEVPVAPASFTDTNTVEPATTAPPFPTASETEPSIPTTVTPDRPETLSEEERIARIFGTTGSGTNGNRITPEGSGIIPTSAEKPVAGFPLADDSFAQADQWIANGQYLNAHRELSQRYWKEDEPLEPLLERLNKTAGMIYFAPQPHFMPAYEVQPGDLLQSVAPQYKLSWEYLARLNRVRPERIRPGQKLKVIKGPFSAFVDLGDFSLTVHAHGYFVKRYAIGIGKDNSTPLGTFSVKEKLKNPKYYGTDAVIEADDPNNPLGERWIDIGDSYGIHGTIDPTSIGKAESRGCLRLSNEDVVEVYDFLTPGSEVVIRP